MWILGTFIVCSLIAIQESKAQGQILTSFDVFIIAPFFFFLIGRTLNILSFCIDPAGFLDENGKLAESKVLERHSREIQPSLQEDLKNGVSKKPESKRPLKGANRKNKSNKRNKKTGQNLSNQRKKGKNNKIRRKKISGKNPQKQEMKGEKNKRNKKTGINQQKKEMKGKQKNSKRNKKTGKNRIKKREKNQHKLLRKKVSKNQNTKKASKKENTEMKKRNKAKRNKKGEKINNRRGGKHSTSLIISTRMVNDTCVKVKYEKSELQFKTSSSS